MSTKENDIALENLEVWLHENDFFFKERKIDKDGFYFERGGERVQVPDNLQDTCQIAENS